jgi:hypothetical protein
MDGKEENPIRNMKSTGIDYISVHRNRLTVLETISFLLYECMDCESHTEAYDLALGLSMLDKELKNAYKQEV